MIENADKLKELYSVEGKTVVISGGAGGIGTSLAWGFLAGKADVILVDYSKEALDRVKSEMTKMQYAVDVVTCDISSEQIVEEEFQQILERHGKIDVLINCAGISMRKPATEHSMEDMEKVFRINVYGMFNCCKAAANYMIKQGGGKIINIGSARGTVGSMLGTVAYGSSKGAVHMMTRQLATEWAQYHINVNCVIPNLTRTPMVEALLEDPVVYESYMSRIPMRRPAEPDEYVGPVMFLASDAASFVTGQLLYVDGGSLAG